MPAEPKSGQPPEPDTGAEAKRRDIERGVFKRRDPHDGAPSASPDPQRPRSKPSADWAGACGHADQTEGHPS